MPARTSRDPSDSAPELRRARRGARGARLRRLPDLQGLEGQTPRLVCRMADRRGQRAHLPGLRTDLDPEDRAPAPRSPTCASAPRSPRTWSRSAARHHLQLHAIIDTSPSWRRLGRAAATAGIITVLRSRAGVADPPDGAKANDLLGRDGLGGFAIRPLGAG